MKVDLVLVTYNPNIPLLEKVIENIWRQVRSVYVIDNSPSPSEDLLSLSSGNVEVHPLYDNLGIAYAQNVGIKLSVDAESDYILLSDQDTLYPANFVSDMLNNSSVKFAAICPLFHDVNQGNLNEGFIIKSSFGFKRIFPKSGLHNIFQAIASGCILNVKSINDIGMMDEGLFIDWVDIEWCWRAIGKGYKVVGNADVTITHHLGDDAVGVGFRDVNLRAPIRHYYITRNAFYLALRCKYLGVLHRLILFIKSFRYLVGFPILAKPHLTHLKYVARGFLDGVYGRLGKYKS